MGNGKVYPDGGFTGKNAKYEPIGDYKDANGLKGCIVKRKDDGDIHSNPPQFANTSDMYFRQNFNGVCQGRVYVDHATFLDFDWSHNHTNKSDGRSFKAGTIHVQVWTRNSDGSFMRQSDNARMMSNAEIKSTDRSSENSVLKQSFVRNYRALISCGSGRIIVCQSQEL